MEKVQPSYIRFAFFIASIMTIFYMLFFFLTNKFNFLMAFSVITIFIFFSSALVFYLHNFKDRIYFGESCITYGLDEKVISYDDLMLIKIELFKNNINGNIITFGSKKDPSLSCRLEVNWFTEKSILKLSKKYLPSDNELYKNLNVYFNKRKLT